MSNLSRRDCIAGLAVALLPFPVAAERRAYGIDRDRSRVGFGLLVAGVPVSGTMAIAESDIQIDPTALARSRVDVSVDATTVAGLPAIAHSAMAGPDGLDTARFPRIRFRSTDIRLGESGRLSNGAKIAGDLTLRDVTRRIVFAAALYRPRSTRPDDLSRLTVELTARVSRREFGVTAFSGLASDTVSIDIRAYLFAV